MQMQVFKILFNDMIAADISWMRRKLNTLKWWLIDCPLALGGLNLSVCTKNWKTKVT